MQGEGKKRVITASWAGGRLFSAQTLRYRQSLAGHERSMLLLQGGTTLSGDFAVGVQKLLALGFNTVKLPFSFSILTTAQPANVTSACQASNATAIQVSVVDRVLSFKTTVRLSWLCSANCWSRSCWALNNELSPIT